MSATEKDHNRKVHCPSPSIVPNTNTHTQPSSLRSIIAGSTAGAIEIGNARPHRGTYTLIAKDFC